MTTIRITGDAAIIKTVDALTGQQLQNAERRAVRAAAKVFQGTLAVVAAGAHVPRSFQKKRAPKVSTHGGASGREVEAVVRPASPLFNIFEPGAKSHAIAPHAKALSGPAGSGGWDKAGRKRPAAFFSMVAVTHPGMSARPILPASFAMGRAPAMDAFAAVLFGSKAPLP